MGIIVWVVVAVILGLSGFAIAMMFTHDQKPEPTPKVLEVGVLENAKFFPATFAHNKQWQLFFEDGYTCTVDGGNNFSGANYPEGFHAGYTYKVTLWQSSTGTFANYPEVELVSKTP